MLFRGIAVAGVLGLVLAACGGDEEEPADDGDTEEPADEGEEEPADEGDSEEPAEATGYYGDCAGGEEVELLVWSSRDYYIPADRGEALMSECPNISLSWDVQSNDDILQQLQRMQAAGQKMPDVIHDDTFLMESYAELGLIQPINDMIAAWEEEAPEFYGSLLDLTFEETNYGGDYFGVSAMANFDYGYYNVELFESVGIPEPSFETYDELFDTLIEIKEENPDAIGLTVQALAGDGVTGLKNMLGTAGAPFDGPKPDLTSSAGIYIIDWFIRAQEADLLPADAISWGESEARGAFIRGDAAMIIDGLTTAADFDDVEGFDYPEQWGTLMLPTQTGQGDEGVYFSSARTWAVTSDAVNADAAGLFLRYSATPMALMQVVKGGGTGPRHTDVLDDPELREVWPHWTDSVEEAFVASEPVPAGPTAGQIEAILEQMFGELVNGTDKSAEEIAEEYQPQLDEVEA